MGWMLWPPIPYSYDTVAKGEGRTSLQPPSWKHLLGTDDLGRDLFSRIMYGSAISLSIGLVGVLTSFILGITLGGISGYYGGAIDTIIQRWEAMTGLTATLEDTLETQTAEAW